MTTIDPLSALSVRADWGEIANVGQLLTSAARAHPSHGVRCLTAAAVESPADALDLSYPELLAMSLRLLARLRAEGVRPGKVVGLLLERPEDFLPTLWACLLGGLVVCPLVPLRGDTQRWAAQLDQVNNLLDGPLVVTTRALQAELPPVGGLAVAVLEELARGAEALDSEQVAVHPARPEDLALLVLTSGSTGKPKAVRLSQGNLVASMRAKIKTQGASAADITFNWVSYDHVAALIEAHLLPLATGSTQLHVQPDVILDDPVRFLRIIDAYRVTMTFTPNFLLGLINKALGHEPVSQMDLSCLRRIISGGEANPVATGVTFLDLLAPHGLARSALWPAFGMTETCAGSIYNRDFPDADKGAEFASVGTPVPGLRIRVVDGTGTLVLDGQAGELQLYGSMVTDGYHKNAAATADARTPDGWLRTGDLGVLRDGRLTLVGRSKDSIIVNGVNYYSHDLEAVLTELDGIERSYVAAFPIRPDGSDTEHLALAFATTVPDDDEATLHRLLNAVRSRVALHWGFQPSALLPLPKDAFPKTSLGKIQRATMRQRAEAGEYAVRQAEIDALINRQLGGYVAPEGETEAALTELYADLFAVGPNGISATAGFFDLGGSSLDTLRLKRSVADRFGTNLPVLSILRAPSVRELARLLDNRPGPTGDAAYDPVVALQTIGKKIPLFCVHPGVGEVLVFVNLAKYLIHERPFYALRARGFNPGERPFGSFEEMVHTYVDAIRKVQPHGPYAIAGYSFGAAVAFEIAKLLEAAGERVDFLGSFNLPPHIKYRMVELDFVGTAVNLAMFLELITKQQAEDLHVRLRPLPRAHQLAALFELAPPGRAAELDLDLSRFTAWAELAAGLTALGATYQPTGTVKSITVFYAHPLHGPKQDWLDNELRRWDEHTREPNRYVEVPGEHYTLMGPQHVDVLQTVLRAELDRALGDA
ncbi:non-ribosomal peptide synthetase [Kibdelosporangium philippinense]|uniref:Non-ribosomal peptide synthetase n=1 Tax=Kibdelosporangium philippinense TaxID=211113 RepID=A0ABS8ZHY6_9PSEU|nr:non-ribosomal peptide synthetase [Kibdelosporangium philippinense]MCE7007117.1 non-ribosomal peptide synthetase [Kibdelosporangium philippinense]